MSDDEWFAKAQDALKETDSVLRKYVDRIVEGQLHDGVPNPPTLPVVCRHQGHGEPKFFCDLPYVPTKDLDRAHIIEAIHLASRLGNSRVVTTAGWKPVSTDPKRLSIAEILQTQESHTQMRFECPEPECRVNVSKSVERMVMLASAIASTGAEEILLGVVDVLEERWFNQLGVLNRDNR